MPVEIVGVRAGADAELVRLREPVQAELFEWRGAVLIPAGTTGRVVFVHQDEHGALAYEVEFCLPGAQSYALASIAASQALTEKKV